jgi:hypothetical protein
MFEKFAVTVDVQNATCFSQKTSSNMDTSLQLYLTEISTCIFFTNVVLKFTQCVGVV